MIRERWKPVIGYEGLYEISDHGRVRSFDRVVSFTQVQSGKLCRVIRIQRSKILSPVLLNTGYMQVCLYAADKTKKRDLIHRLVAQAFLKQPRGCTTVLHLDDVPSNNHYRNLQWGTPKKNSEDMVIKQRSARGEKQGQAKLSEKDVRYIMSSAKSITALAQELDVTPSNISAIRKGKSWNHITGLPLIRNKR